MFEKLRLTCTPLSDGCFGVLVATFPLCQKRHSVSLKRSPRICPISSGKSKAKNAAPVPVLHIKSHQIDEWLRNLGGAPRTRNTVHTSIRTFFSCAKARSYLPKSEVTEVEAVSKVKVRDTEKGRIVPDAEEEFRADASTPQNGRSRARRVFRRSPPSQFLCGFEDGEGNLGEWCAIQGSNT